MQLWALDAELDEEKAIHVEAAKASKEYYCVECKLPVRLRTSPLGVKHFFHIALSENCRQHQRSPLHMKVQDLLCKNFSEGECKQEVRFKEIGRVADIVYYPRKIIFEIQCSWIEAEEALRRTDAYHSIGWSVIWLLSLKRFCTPYPSAFEEKIQSIPHYFFHLNGSNDLTIFDIPSVCIYGKRISSSSLHFALPKKVIVIPLNGMAPHESLVFRQSWKVCLRGDLIDKVAQGQVSPEALRQLCLLANKQNMRPAAIQPDACKIKLSYRDFKELLFRCLKRIFQRFH